MELRANKVLLNAGGAFYAFLCVFSINGSVYCDPGRAAARRLKKAVWI